MNIKKLGFVIITILISLNTLPATFSVPVSSYLIIISSITISVGKMRSRLTSIHYREGLHNQLGYKLLS
jgi:hypothetical protein